MEHASLRVGRKHRALARAGWGALMLAAAGAAQAQSSVTVFGVYDVALRQTKVDGQSSVNSLASNGMAGTRFGFRGIEDLGDGLKAGFWLEADVAGDTGATNATNFLSRRSTVSLIHDRVGELRLGRDYVALFQRQYVRYDPFAVNGIASNGSHFLSTPTLLGSGSGAGIRVDNQVKYVTPDTLGGAFGEFHASAGEGRTVNKNFGGVVGYAGGPVYLTAGWSDTYDTASTDRLKLKTLGASYDFGWARIALLLQTGRYKAREQDTALLALTVPIGAHRIRASVMAADQSGAGTDANDAHQISLGYVHSLSKRTSLYATATKLDNEGVQVFGFGGITPPAGRDIRGFEAGISHQF